MFAIGYLLIPGERSVARIKSEPRAQMDGRFSESVLDRSMLYSRCETEGEGRGIEGEGGGERKGERIFLKRGWIRQTNSLLEYRSRGITRVLLLAPRLCSSPGRIPRMYARA